MAYDSSDKPGSNELDRNPDPITGAPGSHPAGTAIGTGSGALTGAAVGAIGGPVGAVIGLIAGGIVGAFTGHAAGEYNDPTEDYSKAGQKHADPVAAATVPAESAARQAATGTTGKANAMTSGTAAGSTSTRSAASRLEEDDLERYRTEHATQTYATASDDFDNDFAPAYGYGHEVSRHVATTGEAKSANDLDADLRAGWDHVKGTSKLSYDQAKPAIAGAYGRSLKLHEERLNVGKDRVETGNVTLRKEIVTEQKQIEVPVQREEIVITTRALSGEATGETIDETQTLRVPVSEERINIDKQVVATGEVSLDKKVIQDTKTVVDSVRKEVVKVDKTGSVNVSEETATGSR